jgi:GNAT superfamily N-acetyltransferase
VKISIRKSTAADHATIVQWLREENENDGTGFYCNVDVIDRAHSAGNMMVLIEDKVPVAFLANGLTRDGLLEVRADRRRRGYGRDLAEMALQQAIADDVCVLEIQCAPATSIPFWERLGFNIYSENYATRTLSKQLTLPISGEEVDVEIRVHRDPDQHHPDTSTPTHVYKPRARRGSDGVIYLYERVIFSDPSKHLHRDLVGRVLINGEDVFFNKLKYDEASEIGICRDIYDNFYIDRVYAPRRRLSDEADETPI